MCQIFSIWLGFSGHYSLLILKTHQMFSVTVASLEGFENVILPLQEKEMLRQQVQWKRQ